MKPKCSFIATVYNKEAWVSETILSILEQKEKDWELIIVDDGSTDSTLDVLSHYAKQDKRIKVISRHENKGVGVSLNEATEQVESDIIVVASGDDVYEVGRAKKTIEYFKKNPKIDIAYWNFVLVGPTLNLIAHKPVEEFSIESYKKILPNGHVNQMIPHGFSSYRTKVGKTVKYVEDRKVGNDYPFFLHCAEKGFKFGCVNKPKEPIGLYRILPSSVSVKNVEQIRKADYATLGVK